MPNLNFEDMMKYIQQNIVPKVLEQVGDEAVVDLKDQIQKDIYDFGTQNKRKKYAVNFGGNPTYEFKQTPERTDATGNGKKVKVKIFHNTDNLSLDREHFIHGSHYEDDEGNWHDTDVRKSLPLILNNNLSGLLFRNGWWRRRKPYFKNFVAAFKTKYKTSFKAKIELFNGIVVK